MEKEVGSSWRCKKEISLGLIFVTTKTFCQDQTPVSGDGPMTAAVVIIEEVGNNDEYM